MIERDWLEFEVGKTSVLAAFQTTRFYESHGVVVATSCILRRKGKTIGLGVATCNPRDPYTEKAGKKLALARAIKGIAKRNQETPRNQHKFCEIVWEKILATGYFDEGQSIVVASKSTVESVEVAA